MVRYPRASFNRMCSLDNRSRRHWAMGIVVQYILASSQDAQMIVLCKTLYPVSCMGHCTRAIGRTYIICAKYFADDS